MLARLRPRLTFANVVSAVALFVALGGSATAAVLITGGPQATGGSPLSRSGGARGIVVGYLEMLLGPPAA